MPGIDPNMPNSKGKTIKDYLPAAMAKLMGGQMQGMQPPQEAVPAAADQPGAGRMAPQISGDSFAGNLSDSWGPHKIEDVVGKKQIDEAIGTLQEYKRGKAAFEGRLLEEEKWWRLRHWDVVRNRNVTVDDPAEARPEPTSAWLFNSLANKHADIMDNYPEPNVLPRERDDEQDADTLSAILPVVFERNEYEHTYSQAAWYKLKHGVSAKGVFWNNALEDGLGDADIRCIDMLRLYWEPGITDLQASRNLFVVDLVDNDLLEQEYPQVKGKLGGSALKVERFANDDYVDDSKKSVVVDWYYKQRTPEGRTILHYCKFVDSHVLFASENEPDKYPDGFYAHGQYPIELDVLYPEEGTPVGFGLIAIMKSPQMYIDKLSQVILENSAMSAKPRFFVKNSAAIDEKEFLDWSKPLVHYEGDIQNIQPIQVQQVGTNVLNVLQMKIDELKETSSNRDFSQGSSSGGVTAAAAIAALQEAGNKTSRDMISASYRAYTQECYLVIELIRQFYDEARSFRITGSDGKSQYIQFDNSGLQNKLIQPYPGQEMQPGYTPAYRKPVFDIVVKPQKRSPYSKLSQNELAKELYQMGFFNPQLAEQSLGALEMMEFDGAEKVKDRVEQGQTLLNMMQQMYGQMAKMNLIIQRLTGQDVMGLADGGADAAQGAQPARASSGMGKAVNDAQGATRTAYGERLAKQATPDVSQK